MRPHPPPFSSEFSTRCLRCLHRDHCSWIPWYYQQSYLRRKWKSQLKLSRSYYRSRNIGSISNLHYTVFPSVSSLSVLQQIIIYEGPGHINLLIFNNISLIKKWILFQPKLRKSKHTRSVNAAWKRLEILKEIQTVYYEVFCGFREIKSNKMFPLCLYVWH